MSVQSAIYEPPEPGLPMLAVVIAGGQVSAKAIRTRAEGARWIRAEREVYDAASVLDERYGGKRPAG